jgi:cell division protein FtsL
MKREIRWVLVLTLAVMASALAVIQAKHESRRHFSQLQALEKERDQMNVEWGQLQLEQGTWASHSRVERIARMRLNMRVPEAEAMVIIKQ